MPVERAEEARARMLALFPEGFEEVGAGTELELAAYTDGEGEERMRAAFDVVESARVEPDWANRWRSFHRGVRVGPFWVGPPWERPPTDALVIVIDPGRAFGTGAHPTTRLCLELLAGCRPASLLDVGCGSGVLAIAGAKLGCRRVLGLDLDPAAVAAARANADRNDVAMDVRHADAYAETLPAVEVVVANLTLAAVERLAPRLSTEHLVASGYLQTDDPRLDGFERRERRTSDGWAADVFRRAV